ncbi:adenylate kinase [Halomarina oriensis]|uniref:Adenylate kinase n=1 Tax=Halomarina oriensis TaxID=671145 RepID=A0A6B0GML9_9EURY|nr:adenylate kinase [Halomarina oriensis]MWG35171.1 adenylate kinase [Halomarina oriensis]
MSNPRILLIGPPGAGKGTQSKRIVETYGVEHITTGDALRANKDMETDYGKPREYMDKGELVPDPVVNEIVVAALEDADGFVLDGYPRNMSQAEYLDEQTDLDIVALLDVGREELVTRLTGRRVDPETGENYHVEYDMPAEEEIRDRLEQRDDDTEEVVKDRLDVYDENTKPLIEFYEDRGLLARLDGEQAPDDVWHDLRLAIEDAQTDT